MKYLPHIQKDAVGEAVRARFTMVIPILRGMLNATKTEILDQVGGRDNVTLGVFARLYVEGSGDYGICFEYAVHDAIKRRDKIIHPMVSEVLGDFCAIKGDAESILFGLEKNGSANIIETARNSLTDEARVLPGKAGKPPYLKSRLDSLKKAFHNKNDREKLPQSIRGLWKADLFLGVPAREQWIATTMKTSRSELAAAPGLRLGMYPEERRGEGPKRDDTKNLILCPLPYGGDFMELFGATFQIVKQLIAAKGKCPSRVALVHDDDMTVAKWLADRTEFKVVEILDALEPLKQPGLLETTAQEVAKEDTKPEPESKADTKAEAETEAAAPIPRVIT